MNGSSTNFIIEAVYFVVYIFVKDTSYWSIEDSGYFKFIFYFDVMLFGYAIKLNFEKIKKSVKQYRKACVIGSVVSLACFFMIKIIMTKIPRLFCIQFLVQVATLLFAIFTFLTALSLENTLSKWKKCVFGKILLCINSCTCSNSNYMYKNGKERQYKKMIIQRILKKIYLKMCSNEQYIEYLRKKGAKIGKGCDIHKNVNIDKYIMKFYFNWS